MDKYLKYIIILIVSMLLFNFNINAQIVSVEDIPNSTYVIGSYMFTRNVNDEYEGVLTTKLIMLAATTIDDATLDNMVVYYKNARGIWIDGTTGEKIDAPEYFNIDNIDLEGLTTGIIYDANGEGVENMPANTKKEIGEIVYLSSQIPLRNGYEFLGWSTSKYSNSVEYVPGSVYSAESTIVLYAIWNKVNYNVTYNISDTEKIVDSREYGDDINVTNYIPTRIGYTFSGWDIPVFGSDNKVSLNGDINLYAKWQKKEYTVLVNVNNGYADVNSSIVKFGDSISFKIIPYEGYSYGGEKLENCGDAALSNGVLTINNVSSNISCDVTIYDSDLFNRLKNKNADNQLFIEQDDFSYFSGKVTDNYLYYLDNMWRIMGVNADGTIKIILDDGINSSGSYRFNVSGDTEFGFSNVNVVLNEWFNKNIRSNDDYVVLNKYCNSIDDRNCESEYMESKISLPTISDIILGKDYLYSPNDYWTMTVNADDKIYVVSNNNIKTESTNSLNVLRPVITIDGSINVIGAGLKAEPYIAY